MGGVQAPSPPAPGCQLSSPDLNTREATDVLAHSVVTAHRVHVCHVTTVSRVPSISIELETRTMKTAAGGSQSSSPEKQALWPRVLMDGGHPGSRGGHMVSEDTCSDGHRALAPLSFVSDIQLPASECNCRSVLPQGNVPGKEMTVFSKDRRRLPGASPERPRAPGHPHVPAAPRAPLPRGSPSRPVVTVTWETTGPGSAVDLRCCPPAVTGNKPPCERVSASPWLRTRAVRAASLPSSARYKRPLGAGDWDPRVTSSHWPGRASKGLTSPHAEPWARRWTGRGPIPARPWHPVSVFCLCTKPPPKCGGLKGHGFLLGRACAPRRRGQGPGSPRSEWRRGAEHGASHVTGRSTKTLCPA